jgi:indolepyruvate ferredoxin oxidoreductase
MSDLVSIEHEVTLEDKYTLEHGRAMLTGTQALVRAVIEQRAYDRRRGLNTGIFVSGYPGSPLGTFDQELGRARKHLDALDVVFQPGLNEELAATAVAGTQLLGELPRRNLDGVVGLWYGKSPGLDRAADAIRHGNVSGTAPLGGAVALIGDDPACKSSTVPSSSDAMCRSLAMPLLVPGTIQEILELGLHAVALSRAAGSWAGLKLVSDVVDSTAVVELGAAFGALPDLPPRDGFKPAVMLAPANLDAENELFTIRLERAREYALAAGLNRVVFEPGRPRIAVLAAGINHQAMLRALDDLRISRDGLEELGIRLVRLGLSWPLDRGEIRRFAAGTEIVFVVEEKLPFIEPQVRDALYRVADAPLVLGKEDADGSPLLPYRSALVADDIARALIRLLPAAELDEHVGSRLEAPARTKLELLPRRTPYFCSGCPHNTSTRARPDQLVGVGIGCHTLVVMDEKDRRGRFLGMTQMGGEGAQWLGLAPFTDVSHFTQNIGDGTFHHSGSLVIRAAVAANVNMTYKLLYNDAVAMTGGQRPTGRLDVPTLTRWLALEGVKRVVVTTPEPERYRGVTLAEIAEVRGRDELSAVEAELTHVAGVTVVIYDDRCATEKRRLRKRGKLPTPPERVWINERVCEGCGDCGDKSSCLSVVPVDTPWGRKTRIHQGSCNYDMSCLKGDCPSFLVITPKKGRTGKLQVPDLPLALAAPVLRVPSDVAIRMPGIGGTGVVTISQIVQMAAHIEGRAASSLEQIGLAQKGGAVVSDVRIADEPIVGQLRASAGAVDVLLGFDVLGAVAPDTLAVADPARTVAVVNTGETPTSAMVVDVGAQRTRLGEAIDRIGNVTRCAENVYLDALALSDRLFRDHMPANMLLLGAAFQHGCIPLREESIEKAIRLNGTAVDLNLAAFTWGRAAAADPAAVQAAIAPAQQTAPGDPRAASILAEGSWEPPVRRILERAVPELIAFQNESYARGYVEAVSRVSELERERAGAGTVVTEAYARGLCKLMAYKDEYEVARLHLDARERAKITAEFGPHAKVRVMLHPPMLRALGLKRKLRCGPWIYPLLRVLYGLRAVRGTRLDPFGYMKVRRVERELVREYRQLMDQALRHLSRENAAAVAEIADLPDVIRGYEDVKLRSVERFREQASRFTNRVVSPARAGTDAAQ